MDFLLSGLPPIQDNFVIHNHLRYFLHPQQVVEGHRELGPVYLLASKHEEPQLLLEVLTLDLSRLDPTHNVLLHEPPLLLRDPLPSRLPQEGLVVPVVHLVAAHASIICKLSPVDLGVVHQADYLATIIHHIAKLGGVSKGLLQVADEGWK